MTLAHSKKIVFIIFLGGFFMLSPLEIRSQNSLEDKKTSLVEEEEEGPLMYKFEPNFLSAEEQRKRDIKFARLIIDTLTISERKRRRLLKDLYKNGISERLSKTLLVDTKFEDLGNEENQE